MKAKSKLAVVPLILAFLVSSSIAFSEDHSHESEQPHIEISDSVLKSAGVTIESAAPAPIRVVLSLPGRLLPNEDRVAHMTPRFPGVIREVRKRLGDPVEKGEVLAIIESNQTIQAYDLRSLVSGVVTYRHATLGEFASEQSELFQVADYSELFADFSVFTTEFAKLKLGQQVLIRIEGEPPVESNISFISPSIDVDTQSRLARAIVANRELRLQPGGFVSGEIVLSEATAAITVRRTSIQTIDGKPTVFLQEGEKLLPHTVVTGRQDDLFTEVVSGMQSGDRYAAGNTFLLKAELSKGEAEHDH